jgi:hypothetical protein
MRKISELNKDELNDLYNNNSYFKQLVDDYNTEDSECSLEELLYHFRDIRALSYNIGYPANHMTFIHCSAKYDDYKRFINGFEEAAGWFNLSSETLQLVERAETKLDLYWNELCGFSVELTKSNFERLETWFLGIIDKAVEELFRECVNIYEWRNETEIDEDVLYCIADRFDDESYMTDGKYIYALEFKKYA